MSVMSTYTTIGPKVLGWSMKDFRLADFQAAAIPGNAYVESNGFTEFRQEGYEHIPYKGGYGAWQYTGFTPHNNRGRLYLNWCEANHLQWNTVEGSYSFLKHELTSNYAYVVTHLRMAKTVDEATQLFEHYYEGAGVPAMSRRIEGAKIALAAYREQNKIK